MDDDDIAAGIERDTVRTGAGALREQAGAARGIVEFDTHRGWLLAGPPVTRRFEFARGIDPMATIGRARFRREIPCDVTHYVID